MCAEPFGASGVAVAIHSLTAACSEDLAAGLTVGPALKAGDRVASSSSIHQRLLPNQQLKQLIKNQFSGRYRGFCRWKSIMSNAGRKRKDIEMMNKQLGLPDLRTYWRAINRSDRAAAQELRQHRKAKDKKRAKCTCAAYPWPHRPKGGFCRHPDPPIEQWKPKHEWKYRPHRNRYTGLRRKLCIASGLHPVRDRAFINQLMPKVLACAKELKQKQPRVKYRNMTISALTSRAGPDGTTYYDFTLTGSWTTAGPSM